MLQAIRKVGPALTLAACLGLTMACLGLTRAGSPSSRIMQKRLANSWRTLRSGR